MSSTIAWLDTSPEEQRRTREVLRLFEQHESRDELGIGQVRDVLSDAMFPGFSVLHTRARYYLDLPVVQRPHHPARHLRRPRRRRDWGCRSCLNPIRAPSCSIS